MFVRILGCYRHATKILKISRDLMTINKSYQGLKKFFDESYMAGEVDVFTFLKMVSILVKIIRRHSN